MRPQSLPHSLQLAKTHRPPYAREKEGAKNKDKPALSQTSYGCCRGERALLKPHPGLGSALVFAPLRSAPRSLRRWHFAGLLLQRQTGQSGAQKPPVPPFSGQSPLPQPSRIKSASHPPTLESTGIMESWQAALGIQVLRLNIFCKVSPFASL